MARTHTPKSKIPKIQTKAEEVADKLTRRIFTEGMRVGTKLPPGHELAAGNSGTDYELNPLHAAGVLVFLRFGLTTPLVRAQGALQQVFQLHHECGRTARPSGCACVRVCALQPLRPPRPSATAASRRQRPPAESCPTAARRSAGRNAPRRSTTGTPPPADSPAASHGVETPEPLLVPLGS